MPPLDDALEFPQRGHPAHLPAFTPTNRAVIQFVTVCTKDRRPCLNTSDMHDILRRVWTDDTHYRVGRYLLMPDHVHLFCSPSVWPPPPLGTWMRYWKSTAARQNPNPEGKLWQREYWDTQLRYHDSYAAKWNYILNNPVRAGLVTDSADWPYQGEIHRLRWHD